MKAMALGLMAALASLAASAAASATAAVRDANQVVLGSPAGDCDCPMATATFSPTASPTLTPSATPSPNPTPDAALEAIRGLGFAAVWESPGVLLVTLSDEAARFDKGRDELKPDAVSRIGKLAQMIKAYPGNTLSIDGHTDRNGREAYNLRLSKARAERVRIELTRKGVPYRSVTSVEGWGARKPLDTSMTPEGDAQNRRVEIRVRIKAFELPSPTPTPSFSETPSATPTETAEAASPTPSSTPTGTAVAGSPTPTALIAEPGPSATATPALFP